MAVRSDLAGLSGLARVASFGVLRESAAFSWGSRSVNSDHSREQSTHSLLSGSSVGQYELSYCGDEPEIEHVLHRRCECSLGSNCSASDMISGRNDLRKSKFCGV